MKIGRWMRNNWRTVAAVTGAVGAAIAVGLLVAFFPPALAAIAGIAVFGATPFAALATMSLVAASFAAAGIAAAAALALSFLFNSVLKIAKFLDRVIVGKSHDPEHAANHPISSFFRRNWKTVAAVALAAVAGITVGLLVAFFPPALAAIAGVALFGFTPFTALTSMSLVVASFASAGIAAAATLAASFLFNAIVKCDEFLEQAINPKRTKLYASINDDSFDGHESSTTRSMKGLGVEKPSSSCCGFTSPSSEPEPYQPRRNNKQQNETHEDDHHESLSSKIN